MWQSLPASRSASVPGPRRASINVATEIPPAARADLQPIVIGMRPPFTSTGRFSDYLELPRHIVSSPLMHANARRQQSRRHSQSDADLQSDTPGDAGEDAAEGTATKPKECFGGQYILNHGVTRISAIVITTDGGCVESANVPTTGRRALTG